MPKTRGMDGGRFLFVQSTSELGGAETVLLNAFAANAELRQRSAVAMLGFGDGDLAHRLREAGVQVIELSGARLRNPVGAMCTALAIGRTAREIDAQVIVGNGSHPQVYAGLAARLARRRSAYFVHTLYRFPLRSNHPIEILAVKGPCDLAIANSGATREAFLRLRPGIETDVVYPGTPQGLVQTGEAADARKELGATSSEVLFGVFGRLQRGKGQDVFVEAAARALARIPTARFAVIGGTVFGLEPEYEEELKARARLLGLGSRIAFLGQREDVARLMAACDVVCHTSRFNESFGMVIVEAMAQARAVIATRVGGPEEIVENDVTGVLVPRDDAAVLAEAMVRLGRSRELRGAMGEAGNRRARVMFSAEAFAAKLLDDLESLAWSGELSTRP